MTTAKRILTCRIIEKISSDTQYARKAGIEDSSHFSSRNRTELPTSPFNKAESESPLTNIQ